MTLSRRELLAGLGGLTATGAAGPPDVERSVPAGAGPLPARMDFTIPQGQTYLNSAFTHPLPRAAGEAVRHYLEQRGLREPRRSGDSVAAEIRKEFAGLINATPQEIGLIPNTSTGENLVVRGLGIPDGRGNVVTDALHFEGSLILYGELQQRGLDLRLVQPRNWRIELTDIERVVNRQTRLIAVSLVSWYNGFQHDLKALSDLAHAHGAYVYADIVQAAGNTPIDVRASGVDFCACSSFKWLMGDFGLGFLYVRSGLLDRVFHRTVYGYQQADTVMHYLPQDPPASRPVTWTLKQDTSAHVEVGTFAQAAAVCLSHSLPYLRRIGVDAIHAHRQSMLARMHLEIPRLGFTPITPPGTTSAIIAFTRTGLKAQFGDRLAQAQIAVTVDDHRLRVSPSFFNDDADIDALLNALS